MVEERPEEKAEPESRDEAEQPSTSRPEEQPHASEPTYSLEPQPQGEAEQPPASRPQEEPQTQEPPVPEVQAEFSEGSAAAHLNLGAYITRAWDLTTRDFVNVVVGYLIVAAILGASVITLVGPLILTGPLLFGYLWLIQKRLKGEAATVGSVFDGFKDFQKPFLAGLLLVVMVVILAGINLLLNFIPLVGQLATLVLSFFVGSLLYFYLPVAAFSDASPLEALLRSCRFCLDHIGPMLLLNLVTSAIMFGGILVCGIGMIFTVPFAMVICVVAYNEYYLRNVA